MDARVATGDRVRCARDLATATRRGDLRQELTSWRETAAAIAAGLARDELVWLDDGSDNVVERP
ncbi:hypothetical protein JNN96_16775 [Mycobacterium sp. DSM 3803]|nr:hypothetical protein [Mycobacterium sp. DSM 3803]